MTDKQPIIQIRNVSKRFGKVTAVDNVTLDIMAGEVGTAIDARCFAALKKAVAHGLPEKPLPDA